MFVLDGEEVGTAFLKAPCHKHGHAGNGFAVYFLYDVTLTEAKAVGFTLFPQQAYGGFAMLRNEGYLCLTVVNSGLQVVVVGLETYAFLMGVEDHRAVFQYHGSEVGASLGGDGVYMVEGKVTYHESVEVEEHHLSCLFCPLVA